MDLETLYSSAKQDIESFRSVRSLYKQIKNYKDVLFMSKGYVVGSAAGGALGGYGVMNSGLDRVVLAFPALFGILSIVLYQSAKDLRKELEERLKQLGAENIDNKTLKEIERRCIELTER